LPLDYFLLVFVLSIPFWVFGGSRLPLPMDLPVSALMSVNPVIAASILCYKRNGFPGVKELFKKAVDAKRIPHKIWYLPILLLNPFIFFLSYAVMRLTGRPLPDPEIPWLAAPVFFILFFITAVAEELGWTGYALDPLQNRWGALQAGLVLGVIWQIWHLIPDAQLGQPVDWILWHRLGSVALRILIVWIYNNTRKSVFAAILVHATNNLSWSLFPNYGSHYDPFVTCLIYWLTAGIVIFAWGPKTLARFRFAREIRR